MIKNIHFPPVPLWLVKSPPWHIKPGITRWKLDPSYPNPCSLYIFKSWTIKSVRNMEQILGSHHCFRKFDWYKTYPVHRARKFSAVLGTTSSRNSKVILPGAEKEIQRVKLVGSVTPSIIFLYNHKNLMGQDYLFYHSISSSQTDGPSNFFSTDFHVEVNLGVGHQGCGGTRKGSGCSGSRSERRGCRKQSSRQHCGDFHSSGWKRYCNQ